MNKDTVMHHKCNPFVAPGPRGCQTSCGDMSHKTVGAWSLVNCRLCLDKRSIIKKKHKLKLQMVLKGMDK